MKQIKKVIIPAAGWGTRFLPATKTIHKEMLPILNRPAIEILIQEAFMSGIEEVILVISTRKQEIKEYFDVNHELELELFKKNKTELLEQIKETNISSKIRIVFQEEQLGLGHAILVGGQWIHDEPFAVILGDDLVHSDIPCTKQLIEQYDKYHSSILGVQVVSENDLHKYGVVAPNPNKISEVNKKIFKIYGAVEKPKKNYAPSNKAILGRYIFTPKILDILRNIEPSKKSNEIDIIDAFGKLLKDEDIYAFEFEGTRYDLGSIEGFVKATIDYALLDASINENIKSFILEKADEIKEIKLNNEEKEIKK